MVLVLDYEEVRQSITMAGAIEAIESACREQADGQVHFAGRINLRWPTGWIRLMPAALAATGVLGYKEFHLAHVREATEPTAHVRYTMHLFDFATGELLAMMDANYLTAIRTGAAAGVGVKYLAPPEASTVGIIGSGAEARTELEAVAAVRPIRQARVYSRDPGRRERFAREMSEQLGLQILPVERPEAALEDVEIVVAATNTAGSGPALFGRWVRKGLHINSIGSTLPSQREIDPEVWVRADRIVVDTRKVLEETGDGIAAREAQALDERKVAELHEVVAGQAAGRTSPEETTMYKSVGTGIQDVAVAFRIYTEAQARGLGRQMDDYQSVKAVEPN